MELSKEFSDLDVSDLDLFDVEIVPTSSYVLMPETGASCCACCTFCCSVVPA